MLVIAASRFSHPFNPSKLRFTSPHSYTPSKIASKSLFGSFAASLTLKLLTHQLFKPFSQNWHFWSISRNHTSNRILKTGSRGPSQEIKHQSYSQNWLSWPIPRTRYSIFSQNWHFWPISRTKKNYELIMKKNI